LRTAEDLDSRKNESTGGVDQATGERLDRAASEKAKPHLQIAFILSWTLETLSGAKGRETAIPFKQEKGEEICPLSSPSHLLSLGVQRLRVGGKNGKLKWSPQGAEVFEKTSGKRRSWRDLTARFYNRPKKIPAESSMQSGDQSLDA